MVDKRKLSTASRNSTKRRLLSDFIQYITPRWIRTHVLHFSDSDRAIQRDAARSTAVNSCGEKIAKNADIGVPSELRYRVNQSEEMTQQYNENTGRSQVSQGPDARVLSPEVVDSIVTEQIPEAHEYTEQFLGPVSRGDTIEPEPHSFVVHQERERVFEGDTSLPTEAQITSADLRQSPEGQSSNCMAVGSLQPQTHRDAEGAVTSTSPETGSVPVELRIQLRSRRPKEGRASRQSVEKAFDNVSGTLTRSMTLYNSMKDEYNLTLPYEQFRALCAYLCAMLRLGWPVYEQDFDHYVVGYPEYAAALGGLEEVQVQTHQTTLLSYHEWFQAHIHPAESKMVLTESALRSIWEEHPYTFLKAAYQLRAIAEANQKRRGFTVMTTHG